MPHMYGQNTNILQETISRIAYKTEYSEQYTGTREPLQHVRIPSRLHRPAWERFPNPGTSRAIQPPCQSRTAFNLSINSQGLQPRQIPRSKSTVYQRRSNFSPQSSSASCSTSGRQSLTTTLKAARDRPTTDEILKRPPSFVARRLQSQLSRFPKDFRYIDKQCFFHPAEEPRRGFFVIAPDWVSERRCKVLRKNNVFG